MLFGKVVVGPDCGNVGPLLRHWNYPVFPVDDTSNIGGVVEKELQMSKMNQWMKYKELQLHEYSTASIAMRLYETYYQAVNPI